MARAPVYCPENHRLEKKQNLRLGCSLTAYSGSNGDFAVARGEIKIVRKANHNSSLQTSSPGQGTPAQEKGKEKNLSTGHQIYDFNSYSGRVLGGGVL